MLLAVAAGCRPAGGGATVNSEATMIRKVTPVMVVDAIEPVLPFWVERLGWEQTVGVPDSARGALGFVILMKDGVELMFQTRHSIADDMAALASEPFPGHTPLFIEVADLAEVQRRLADAEVIEQERTTFYGSRETIVRAPYGQIVTFAQFPPAEAQGQ